ncbi:MAG: tryptophan synthase subunit alpha [Opitutaceae bacterium]|nr:tryptophan synthase subunit alpha [Opitutaceae bacterium]|tara:strand:+ start:11713 stop:12516 length:804 start_codon:yes stop_codon:yes gene_type:complete
MDRIAAEFSRAKDENRKSFIAYLCAGDPNYETSLKVTQVVLESGVHILEFGVPFSDPLADGWTNQCAAKRALDSGITKKDVLNLIRASRVLSAKVPIVLYAYYNQIFSQGTENYLNDCLEAGVDAILALDLPPMEAEDYLATCERVGMKTVFIVAPTTPGNRICEIAKASTGFVYYVSREGVTGVRDSLETSLPRKLKTIQENTSKPVVVGFGISKPSQVREVAEIADGVVVGSAIVNVIADHLDDEEAMLSGLRNSVRELSEGVLL